MNSILYKNQRKPDDDIGGDTNSIATTDHDSSFSSNSDGYFFKKKTHVFYWDWKKFMSDKTINMWYGDTDSVGTANKDYSQFSRSDGDKSFFYYKLFWWLKEVNVY